MINKSFKVLFLGDITGRPGRMAVHKFLSSLCGEEKPDFVVANVENASHGFGLTKKNYDELLSYGIDCFTAGNHIFDKKEIFDYIAADNILVRPINYPNYTIGCGCRIFEKADKRIAVLNALGQVFMPPINSPLECLADEIEKIKKDVDYIIVDFHGEATAEKIAIGRFLSEKGVTLFAGTHTHVQTADEKIINGMGYITDAGFCGSADSVIGMDYEISINRFLTPYPVRYEVAPAKVLQVNAVVACFDDKKTISIKRINELYKDDTSELRGSGGENEG